MCKQSFKTKSQLSDHILKHTQIKNYSCPECKSSFSRKSRLKIHLMIHRGEKPFQCNICNKKFREKSNYNYHIKKHFVKTIKSLNKKSENKKDGIIMDTNINNFCIFKNKPCHKSSDISNNSSSTNGNSNNNSDIINSDNEINVNFENNKENSLFKLNIVNNNAPNTNIINNNNFCNDSLFNFFTNKLSNRLSLFEREEDLKSMDEQLIKNDLNINNSNNNLFNNQYIDYFNYENNSSNIFPKENTQIKEEVALDEEEKNKTVQNFEEVSIVNNNVNDLYIDNTIKDKNNLIVANNNIENEIKNKIYYNNNCYSSDLGLNFETMFLKNNFNYNSL